MFLVKSISSLIILLIPLNLAFSQYLSTNKDYGLKGKVRSTKEFHDIGMDSAGIIKIGERTNEYNEFNFNESGLLDDCWIWGSGKEQYFYNADLKIKMIKNLGRREIDSFFYNRGVASMSDKNHANIC